MQTSRGGIVPAFDKQKCDWIKVIVELDSTNNKTISDKW